MDVRLSPRNLNRGSALFDILIEPNFHPGIVAGPDSLLYSQFVAMDRISALFQDRGADNLAILYDGLIIGRAGIFVAKETIHPGDSGMTWELPSLHGGKWQ